MKDIYEFRPTLGVHFILLQDCYLFFIVVLILKEYTVSSIYYFWRNKCLLKQMQKRFLVKNHNYMY